MNNALFEAHATLIAKRWPALIAPLRQAWPSTLTLTPCHGQSMTWCVDGVQLSSRHDPIAEAELQASSLADSPTIHLYGSGLGYLAEQLLTRTKLQTLHLHILSPALWAVQLALREQSTWLNDPRVKITLAAEEQELALPFFPLPADLILASPAAWRISGRLVSELSARLTRQRFSPDTPRIVARLKQNEPLIAQDGDVASLFATHPNSCALVIASGPTLAQNVAPLKRWLKLYPDTLILAVDTALPTLLQGAIAPHIVVTIDEAITPDKLRWPTDTSACLVYGPLALSQTLLQWQGPRLVAYSASPMYQQLRQRYPKGVLHQGGSVLHPTVDLAHKMGACEILLVGCDFAFVDGQSHSGWQDGQLGVQLLDAQSWVMSGQGERLATNPNFTTYQIELERYIKAHPQLRFYTTSLKGADILGCPLHPKWPS